MTLDDKLFSEQKKHTSTGHYDLRGLLGFVILYFGICIGVTECGHYISPPEQQQNQYVQEHYE